MGAWGLGLLGCGASTAAAPNAASSSSTESAASSSAGSPGADEAIPTPGALVAPSGPPPPALLHPRSNRAWLGVELKALPEGKAGVLVAQAFPHSPAARAGLRSGDVLLMLDARAVMRPDDVAQIVQEKDPSARIAVAYERDGVARLARVDLEGTPDFEDRVRLAFVGTQAPEIAGVTTFQGETTALSDVRGKVVVLEFWASFCGVCRYLAPTLDRWHRTYRPQGAEVIGITVDTPSEGAEVAAELGMSYTLASDGSAKTTRTYLASQVPMLVLIDKKGRVREVMVGYSTPRVRELESLLVRLLEEPA